MRTMLWRGSRLLIRRLLLLAGAGAVTGALACLDRADWPAHPTGPWPHEPPGFIVLTDQRWRAVGSAGWGHLNRASQSRVLMDPTAPFSPPNVLEHVYPVGFRGGNEPAVDWYPLPGPASVFVGFWWRASDPWQGHTVVNKLTFTRQWEPSNSEVSASAILGVGASPFNDLTDPAAGPWTVRAALQYRASNGHLPNSTGDDPGSRNLFGNSQPLIRQGNGWHRIEMLLIRSTSPISRDGVVRWWVDGQLAGDYSTVNFDPYPFAEFQFAPTWGGMGEVKRQRDYLRFGPIRISHPP